jgi:hypothetical protein
VTSQSTSPDANVELVRAAARAFNAGNTDECLVRIAPDFIINLAELPEPMHGREAWRQNFETMKHASPPRTRSPSGCGSAAPTAASSSACPRPAAPSTM